MDFIKHPACTRVLGAPPGMEDSVNALPVAELSTEIGVGLFSFWKPDAEELAMLNAGHALALGVYSHQHPIVSMGVTKEPV